MTRLAGVIETHHCVEVSCVVHLEFGLDVQLTHARRQATDPVGWIAELTLAERHRAGVQRGHARTQLHQLLAVLELHRQAHARGQLDVNRALLLDEVHRATRDGKVGRRPFVLVTKMQVRHGRTLEIGLVNGVGDLLGRCRQVLVVGLEGDRPGGCDGADDAHQTAFGGFAMETASTASESDSLTS